MKDMISLAKVAVLLAILVCSNGCSTAGNFFKNLKEIGSPTEYWEQGREEYDGRKPLIMETTPWGAERYRLD